MSQLAVIHHSAAHLLPATVAETTAPFAEPLAVAIHALARSNYQPDQRLLVIGAGTIGLCTVMAARATGGPRELTVVARHHHQAAMARQLGADQVLSPDTRFPDGVDVVINTATGSAALRESIQACRRRATILLVGGHSKANSVELRPVVSREIRIIGSICYNHDEFRTAINWLVERIVDPRALLTHEFDLKDVKRAFETALDKSTGSVKVLINVRAES